MAISCRSLKRGKISLEKLILKHGWMIFFFLILLTNFRASKLRGWDEAYYWGQLTSLFYDGDLVLQDDLLANHNRPVHKYWTVTTILPDGALFNAAPIGIAVVNGAIAGPALFLARVTGIPRYHQLTLAFIALGALIQIWLVMLSIRFILLRFGFPSSLSGPVAVCSFLGTPLVMYSLRFSGMSHLLSSCLSCLFVVSCLLWIRKPNFSNCLFVGIVSGLLIITRWQNCIFALFILPILFTHPRGFRTMRKMIAQVFLVVVLIGAIFCFQGFVWMKQFGGFWGIPYSSSYMHWGKPDVLPLLFSGFHGLLPWSPIFLPAIIGLFLGMKRKGEIRWLYLGAALTLFASIYVNASANRWWAGASYGVRRMSCMIPFVALGFAELYMHLRKQVRIALVVFILVWAHFTMTCYREHIDDLSYPLLGRRSAAAATDRTEDYVTSAREARGILKHELFSPSLRMFRIIRTDRWRNLVRFFGPFIIFFVFLFSKAGFVSFLRRRSFRKICLWAVSIYLSFLLVFLYFFVPGNRELNREWKSFLRNPLVSESVVPSVPRAAVVFVRAVYYIKRGDEKSAVEVLSRLEDPEHSWLDLEAVREGAGERGGSGER